MPIVISMREKFEPRDDWDSGDHYFPSGLDFEGCACAEGVVDGTMMYTHCHRVVCGHNCDYAGVHYAGNVEVARKVADYIANAYACEVDLVDVSDEILDWMETK